MSSLKVEIVQIKAVEPHFNADRLEIATIAGWTCVVGKGQFVAGDTAVYIPIDAILGPQIECYLFPPDSKIKLSKSRVRTIKLRGAVSQGILVQLTPELYAQFPKLKTKGHYCDVADILGITKYEPPAAELPNLMRPTSKKKPNPNFKNYTDIENFKYYADCFEPGEIVYVTEKLHGTSARYAMMLVETNTWWKKLLRFLRLLPSHEYCFGSRRVQLQEKPRNHKCFYEENVYAIVGEKYNFKQLLRPGEAVYGEIVGHGIQGGYTYGTEPGDYWFFAYDLMRDGQYLNAVDFCNFCDERGIPRVPNLGVIPHNSDVLNLLRQGDSTVGDQKVREGIVVKPVVDRWDHRCGRLVLKYINDAYLLGEQTDFQ